MVISPACPLCGNHESQARFSQRGYELRVCNHCELLFIDPYPAGSDEVYERTSDYSRHEMASGHTIVDPKGYHQASVQVYKKYLPMVMKACEGAKSVLDVGCGSGYLLQQLGSNPALFRCGIELNEDRAEMARNISGCVIHQVPIEQFTSQEKFDAIIMMNVLSHIHSHDKLFSSLRSLLSDNGKLILKVGEFGKQPKRSDVRDWEIPDHLHFLGHNTINYICDKYDFRIDTHYRVPYYEDVFSRDQLMAPGRSQFRDMLKKVIVYTPFALSALAKVYTATRGRNVSYSSFIVLSSYSP